MKVMWIIAAVFSALAVSPSYAAKEVKVNPYGKYFQSGDGSIAIEMAVLEGKNEDDLNNVLLKIKGAAAHSEGIDGKVMMYVAEPAGTGANFVYTKDGKKKTRMISRDSWGSWKMFEVFVNGEKFHVYVDQNKSSEVKTAHLLTEFNGKKKK